MKILVVEDEPKTAASLRKGLRERGYAVDVAADGADGLFLATTDSYDTVILDITLPLVDGWSILTRMRAVGQSTPVLVLTARDSVHDRVKGLELGADDYLIKPFAFAEMLARVRSLTRRIRPGHVEVLRIANLEIDLLQHQVSRAGRRIALTPKEFSLLLFMAQRAGEVLSRTVIAEHVWNMDFDSDTNVVDVAIRRLRSKVDDPFERKLIHSVRGMGYLLEERPRDH